MKGREEKDTLSQFEQRELAIREKELDIRAGELALKKRDEHRLDEALRLRFQQQLLVKIKVGLLVLSPIASVAVAILAGWWLWRTNLDNENTRFYNQTILDAFKQHSTRHSLTNHFAMVAEMQLFTNKEHREKIARFAVSPPKQFIGITESNVLKRQYQYDIAALDGLNFDLNSDFTLDGLRSDSSSESIQQVRASVRSQAETAVAILGQLRERLIYSTLYLQEMPTTGITKQYVITRNKSTIEILKAMSSFSTGTSTNGDDVNEELQRLRKSVDDAVSKLKQFAEEHLLADSAA